MNPHILIVDDHSIVRTGLKLMLESKIGIPLLYVQEASNCHEMMNKLRKEKFSHIFLDVALPDGNALEMITPIKKLYPGIEILMITMQSVEMYANILKPLGIHYYVSKSFNENEILKIIRAFLNNDKKESIDEKNIKNINIFSQLSAREMQVLHYMLNGLNTKAISQTLGLQKNTVSTHKKRIFDKTNTGNLRQLIELATIHDVNF